MSDAEKAVAERDARELAEMCDLPTLELRRHGGLTVPRDGDVLLALSVGPAGEAVTLWCAEADRDGVNSVTVQPGWATFPDARSARPAGARIAVHSPDAVTTVVDVAALAVAHATVQPLPGGRFLVVGARCRWRPEGPDRNAIVYGPDGGRLSEHTLGDGIEHLLTTPSGQIWAGYFDEGVYGNCGWGGPGPEPLGESGLVRFGPGGEPAWEFPGDKAIDDCYALNVSGETAWACYYTDFPVVRVSDGAVTTWANGLATGVKGLIADGSRVGLIGGYRAYLDRVVVASLGDGVLHETGRYRLVLPGGDLLPDRFRTVARGPDLHLFVGADWYRLTLDDLP
ncbi:hypothetical protein [Actinoplanes utahensis]|uniref:hypothetical protein n=1 Tax=Actinoplanes utahensis TaxID=1869 RepID=UPI00068E2F5C|nr:hypothetical protein [Actinoplanes utahensis]GIF30754.1 hypothetical protein Aut01nite_37400 [Actinoplanes utahensis]